MNPFLVSAVLALLLAAVAAGAVGSLVVVRRASYVAGAVSHCVLAGLGLSLLLSRRWDLHFLPPMAGALLVAVAVALVLARLSGRRGARADAALSAIWTGGIALGVLFVSLTPGYQTDLMSYLFGSVLYVSPAELVTMAVLDLVILAAVVLCYNRFLAVAFDAELAALRGVNVRAYEYAFYLLTALTVVLLVSVVGVVLAVALLALPASAAGRFTRRLSSQMVLAALFAALAGCAGLAVSWFADVPASAAIVLAALVIDGLAILIRPVSA